MALVNCINCGKQISDKAESCINCGNSIISTTNEDEEQSLTIIWEGKFFIFDAKTEIFVNGVLHSKQSTKKGFRISIPLSNNVIEIKLSLLGGYKSTKFNLNIDPRNSYELEIFYDALWGGYSDEYKLIQL